MDGSPTGSSVHGDSPGKNTGVGCHALLQGIFQTEGIEAPSSALQADSLLSEPPGKGHYYQEEGKAKNPKMTLYRSFPFLRKVTPDYVFTPRHLILHERKA